MDITNVLLSQLGNSGIEDIANQIGANKTQAKSAIEGIVPTLLAGMANNAKSSGGAESLLKALSSGHDGSIFDNLGGFLSNFSQGDGAGILKHVLGGNQGDVAKGLSKKTGLDIGQISQLMVIVAPLVMGYLGKQKRKSAGGFDSDSIAGLLGGLAKSSDQATSLDLGDVLNVVGGLGGGNQGGGLGGLLGNLFKG